MGKPEQCEEIRALGVAATTSRACATFRAMNPCLVRGRSTKRRARWLNSVTQKEALTFDMSGGPKGAKRPLARPLDGGVRCLRSDCDECERCSCCQHLPSLRAGDFGEQTECFRVCSNLRGQGKAAARHEPLMPDATGTAGEAHRSANPKPRILLRCSLRAPPTVSRPPTDGRPRKRFVCCHASRRHCLPLPTSLLAGVRPLARAVDGSRGAGKLAKRLVHGHPSSGI